MLALKQIRGKMERCLEAPDRLAWKLKHEREENPLLKAVL